MAPTTTKEHEQEEGQFIDYYCQCGQKNLKTIFFMSKTKILSLIKERSDSTDGISQTCIKDKMTRTTIPKRFDTGTC